MAQEKVRRADAKVAHGNAVVLDAVHRGDIRGAFGTLGEHEQSGARSWRRRLLALAVIIGPGLIVMVGDNDAGGVSTYAAAGQDYGASLLWTLLLLIPVLIVNQEMVVRLGAVSGVGHGRLIFERFGKIWGRFAVSDLFVLNFLTIATEFIGISLGAQYFGVPAWIAVPLAGLLLVGITVTGRFETWERLMFVILFGNLLCIPLMLLCHPTLGPVVQHFVIPGIQGGLKLQWRPAHRCRRRHNGHPVAAVFSAVERRRQTHHATLDPLRTGRHGDRRDDRGYRSNRHHGGHGLRVRQR